MFQGSRDGHRRLLYGPTEAARFLGISRATLHRLVKAGAISPAMQTPAGFRRFALEELERFEQSMVRAGTPPEATAQDVLREERRRHEILLDFAEQLGGLRSTRSVCMATASVVASSLPSGNQSSVWILNPRTGYITRLGHAGLAETFDPAPSLLKPDTPISMVIQTRRPYICKDSYAPALKPYVARRAQRAGMRSFCMVAIASVGGIEGVVILGSRRPSSFDSADLQFLQQVSKLAGNALDTACCVEQFERVSTTVEQLSAGLIRGESIAGLASTAAGNIIQLIEAEVVLISKIVSDPSRLQVLVACTLEENLELEDEQCSLADHPDVYQAISEYRSIRVDNLFLDSNTSPQGTAIARRFDAPVWHIFPLASTGGPLGVVSIGFSGADQISQNALGHVSTIIRHLGLALSCHPARTAEPTV